MIAHQFDTVLWHTNYQKTQFHKTRQKRAGQHDDIRPFTLHMCLYLNYLKHIFQPTLIVLELIIKLVFFTRNRAIGTICKLRNHTPRFGRRLCVRGSLTQSLSSADKPAIPGDILNLKKGHHLQQLIALAGQFFRGRGHLFSCCSILLNNPIKLLNTGVDLFCAGILLTTGSSNLLHQFRSFLNTRHDAIEHLAGRLGNLDAGDR